MKTDYWKNLALKRRDQIKELDKANKYQQTMYRKLMKELQKNVDLVSLCMNIIKEQDEKLQPMVYRNSKGRILR